MFTLRIRLSSNSEKARTRNENACLLISSNIAVSPAWKQMIINRYRNETNVSQTEPRLIVIALDLAKDTVSGIQGQGWVWDRLRGDSVCRRWRCGYLLGMLGYSVIISDISETDLVARSDLAHLPPVRANH